MWISFNVPFSQALNVSMVYLDKDSGELLVAEDAFYNYLTAWYRSELMMYYVSQGFFFPEPADWTFDKEKPLKHSWYFWWASSFVLISLCLS